MRRPGATLLILGFLSLASALPSAEGRVEVFSDALRITDRTGVVHFEGHVRVELEEGMLTCDRLVIRTSADDPSRILSGTAFGNVVLVHGTDRAEADQAVFDLERGTVELKGSPRLLRDSASILADRIVYLLEQGTATLYGPVRAVFETGEK